VSGACLIDTAMCAEGACIIEQLYCCMLADSDSRYGARPQPVVSWQLLVAAFIELGSALAASR